MSNRADMCDACGAHTSAGRGGGRVRDPHGQVFSLCAGCFHAGMGLSSSMTAVGPEEDGARAIWARRDERPPEPAPAPPVQAPPPEPQAPSVWNPSEPVSHHNLQDFLTQQSDWQERADWSLEAPAHWVKLGSLYDEALGATVVIYGKQPMIAVGFYPFNGCDIYRDTTTKDILLSYVEVGGHIPARISFRITKHSSFVFEPVSTDITVAPERLEEFYSAMRGYGLTREAITAQAAHFKSMYIITETLPADRITVVRADEAGLPKKELRFSLVADRKTAAELRRRFHSEGRASDC